MKIHIIKNLQTKQTFCGAYPVLSVEADLSKFSQQFPMSKFSKLCQRCFDFSQTAKPSETTNMSSINMDCLKEVSKPQLEQPRRKIF